MMTYMLEIPWYVFALLGALFVSFASVFEKKVLIHDEPLHFSASSSALIGILSLPFLFFVDWSAIPSIAFLIMYGVSILAMLAFCLVAFSLRALEAGEQTLILALTPAVTALFGFLFLGETLSTQAFLGLILIVVGLIVLEFPSAKAGLHSHAFRKKLVPIFLAFGAVVVYSLSAVGDRIVLGHYDVDIIDFLMIVQVMALANFLVLSWFDRSHKKLLTSSFRRHPMQVATFSILLILSRLMHSQAVSMAYVALAAAIKRSGALFTIVIARTYLKERSVGHKLLAGGIILAGVLSIIL
ncbi:MAG TPA: DMT family transporter [Candidatus Paceibacterota bacterium]|nr:DMT family transporter [Candidatus Paceibacterota bacterium]